MTEKTKYWIWMQMALGTAARLAGVSDPEQVYAKVKSEKPFKGFTPVNLTKLECADIESAEDVIERCADLGVTIVTPSDSSYPELLLELPSFPAALYCRGDTSLLTAPLPIAIVGSREPLVSSASAAALLSGTLSKCGFTVVSGGARGVDYASHTGALNAGAPTVAVLGSAINDHTYLKQCESLREVIAQNGLLVSEYMPDTRLAAGSFPKRNRIIAGMTLGTVVIEAKRGSGSLGTAAYAAEFDRDVFALSAKGQGLRFAGAEALIRDGAVPAACAADIIREYISARGEHIRFDKTDESELLADLTRGFNASVPILNNTLALDAGDKLSKTRQVFHSDKLPITDPLTENARNIYELFDGIPRNTEEFYGYAKVKFPQLRFAEITAALTELEIFDYIEMQPDRRYKLK